MRRRGRGLRGPEAEELRLYIDNEADLYGQYMAIRKNLCKKRKRGVYDNAKAPKLFMYLVDRGAKKYACEMASCREWNKIFSVAERRLTAQHMADDFIRTSCSEWGLGRVKRARRR